MIRSLVVIALLTTCACSASQKAAEHTAIACAESAAAHDLTATAESILVSGVSNWEAQLAALAQAFGLDVVNCAVQAAKTLLVAHVTGSATDVSALQRADQWIAEHAR